MDARRFAAQVAFVCSSFAAATPARAFQIESPVSVGCHERITLAVLDDAGWPDGATPPPVDRADRAVVDDLPFRVPEDARDLWTLSLVIGARDNDLRGHAIEDFAETTKIHNDPDGQAAHCLRSPWDDGAQGDLQAVAECREFILDQLEQAIGDADEAVDLDVTEQARVALAFRGSVDIPVTRFAFHAGKALHAVEDGFTHTFRSPDGKRIRHVLNWVDWAVEPHYSVERDGHAHMDALDLCDEGTEARRHRVDVATEAGAALLAAIADSTGGREGRMERARAVLDEYFTVESGCTYENDWCQAPELGESTGCNTVPGAPVDGGTTALFALLGLGVLVPRRRLSARALGVIAGLVASVAAASPAFASDPPPADADVSVFDQAPRRSSHPFAIAASAGFSVQRSAVAGALGWRYELTPRLVVGADAEWNPWVTVVPADAVAGVANFYGVAAYRIATLGRGPRATELRTTVQAGVSVLLTDLVGARAGSTGPYLGWNLLGLEVPVGSAKLIINPASVALPVPQLHGVPFYYLQYRATFGIEASL